VKNGESGSSLYDPMIDPFIACGGKLNMEKIKDNIYVETGFLGCNPSFVVTSNGIIIIDTPQRPSEAFKWRKEIQTFGEIAYIINTDHHADHAVGNYYFDADIIMHETTAKRLDAERFRDWLRLIEPQAESVVDHYFVKKPKFTFSERMNLYIGEDVFELMHVKSHTEDETLIYMPKKKVLFAGDTVCTNALPSLRESYPLEWLECLQKIEELDFEVLVPGHGKIGDKNSVRWFRKELSTLINSVRERIDRGVSRDEIIRELRYEDVVHSKYPASFSAHFDQNMNKNIGRLYDFLKEE
jgi:cyclase